MWPVARCSSRAARYSVFPCSALCCGVFSFVLSHSLQSLTSEVDIKRKDEGKER